MTLAGGATLAHNWTPMHALRRAFTDGEWYIVDDDERVAVVRELRLGPKRERMFRVVTWAGKSEDRTLIGYFPNMQMAVEITWREYVKAVGGRVRRRG